MFNLFKRPAPPPKNLTGKSFAIVAMIGNECDIIELFLRHNQPFCDKFYIVLHNSLDATASIIEKLQAEGFAIDVQISHELAYEQDKITQNLARTVAQTNQHDYIVILDADEFVPYDNDLSFLQTIKSKISPDGFGIVHRINFIPMAANYFTRNNPLVSGFCPYKNPKRLSPKVVLGANYAKQCILIMGNHGASHETSHALPIDLDMDLLHFPIRSSAQMVRKYLLGTYSSMLKENVPEGESYHWYEMLASVRQKNYQPNHDFILKTVLGSVNKGSVVVLDKKQRPMLDKRIKIRYPDLMAINLLRDMDNFITSCITTQKNNAGQFETND